MALKINDSSMAAEVGGTVIATATRTGDRWTASNWPHTHTLTRNQAITALMIAEYLAVGYSDDDPFVIDWRAELPCG